MNEKTIIQIRPRNSLIDGQISATYLANRLMLFYKPKIARIFIDKHNLFTI